MATGKLVILVVVAMATTLVVVTQAEATELDGQPFPCVLIGWGPCVAHLTGKGPMEGCCFILNALGSKECQCWAMESISKIPCVDKEYAKNLPKKCGTLDESCSFKTPYIYM